jgi:hypothetical protein
MACKGGQPGDMHAHDGGSVTRICLLQPQPRCCCCCCRQHRRSQPASQPASRGTEVCTRARDCRRCTNLGGVGGLGGGGLGGGALQAQAARRRVDVSSAQRVTRVGLLVPCPRPAHLYVVPAECPKAKMNAMVASELQEQAPSEAFHPLQSEKGAAGAGSG